MQQVIQSFQAIGKMPRNRNSRHGTPAAAQSAINALELDRRVKKFKAELEDTDRRVKALDKLLVSKRRKEGSSAKNDADLNGEIEKILRSLPDNYFSSSGQK